MKKIFLLLVVVCILFSACGGQKNTQSVSPSVTPEQGLAATPTVTSTATLAATSKAAETATSIPAKIFPFELPTEPKSRQNHSLVLTPTPTATPTPTPTATPFPPYQTKRVIFNYYEAGWLSSDLSYFDPVSSGAMITRIVLYDDGQMILWGKNQKYRQKFLSPAEITQFLSKLDALGFYSLESDQSRSPSDKLYEFGNNYEKIYDATSHCILVNSAESRELCVYDPYMQFVIPKMKNILNYLDGYQPAGMTAYVPDRILLIFAFNPDSYAPSETVTVTPWNDPLLSLESAYWDTPYPYTDVRQPTVYLTGDIAKEIYQILAGADGHVFSENGNKYTVFFRVVLPHQKIINPYQ